MSDVIKVIKKECFIDSEGLAILSDNEHRAVTQLIRTHKTELEDFGVMTFEMSKPNKQGGRPSKIWLLNEYQATLLTTFMQNTPVVRKFKIKLVKDFFKMREYIQSLENERIISKRMRRTLTDSVTESGENERMHGYGFSNYTMMIYDIVGIKDKYNEFKNGTDAEEILFRDTLTPDELKRVVSAEALVKPLLDMEKKYSEIKETLRPLFEVKKLEEI